MKFCHDIRIVHSNRGHIYGFLEKLRLKRIYWLILEMGRNRYIRLFGYA